MQNLGIVKPGSKLVLTFDTFDGGTGAPITMTGFTTADIEIYKDVEFVTQRASDSGYALLDDGIDVDGITGVHALSVDLADNSMAGRDRVNTMLRPEDHTLRPRLHVSAANCPRTNMQMKRYVWDDHKLSLEKAQKQIPKAKDDDYPSLLRYLANFDPRHTTLREGMQIVHRRRDQKGMSRYTRRREAEEQRQRRMIGRY